MRYAWLLTLLLLGCKTMPDSLLKGAALSCFSQPQLNTVSPASGSLGLPRDGEATVQIATGQKVSDVRIVFLKCGAIGGAFKTLGVAPAQVLKVSLAGTVPYFQQEVDLFGVTAKRLRGESGDARLFADFMVETEVVSVTYEGRRGTGLLKRYVDGVELNSALAVDSVVSEQLDRLFLAYRAAHAAGYQIGDLKYRNIMWDQERSLLQIVDATDYGRDQSYDFMTLCTAQAWCRKRFYADKYRQEAATLEATPAKVEADRPDSDADGTTDERESVRRSGAAGGSARPR